MLEFAAAEIAAEAKAATTEVAAGDDAAEYHDSLAPATAQYEVRLHVLKKKTLVIAKPEKSKA